MTNWGWNCIYDKLGMELYLWQTGVETVFMTNWGWNCIYDKLGLKLYLWQTGVETVFTTNWGWNYIYDKLGWNYIGYKSGMKLYLQQTGMDHGTIFVATGPKWPADRPGQQSQTFCWLLQHCETLQVRLRLYLHQRQLHVCYHCWRFRRLWFIYLYLYSSISLYLYFNIIYCWSVWTCLVSRQEVYLVCSGSQRFVKEDQRTL